MTFLCQIYSQKMSISATVWKLFLPKMLQLIRPLVFHSLSLSLPLTRTHSLSLAYALTLAHALTQSLCLSLSSALIVSEHACSLTIWLRDQVNKKHKNVAKFLSHFADFCFILELGGVIMVTSMPAKVISSRQASLNTILWILGLKKSLVSGILTTIGG